MDRNIVFWMCELTVVIVMKMNYGRCKHVDIAASMSVTRHAVEYLIIM